MSGVAKGIKRVFKAVGKAIKTIVKSPIFKAIVIAAVAYFTFGAGTSLFAAPEVVATDALLVESVAPVVTETMVGAPTIASAAELGVAEAATDAAFSAAMESVAAPIVEEGLAAIPEIASADVAAAAGDAAATAGEAAATAAEEVATTGVQEVAQNAATETATQGVVEQAVTTGTEAAQVAPQVGEAAATTAESTVNAVTQAAAEGSGQAANIGQGIIDQSIGMQNVANSGVLDSIPQFAMQESSGIIDQMTSIWKGLSSLEKAAIIKGAGSGIGSMTSAYAQGKLADDARKDRLARGTPQDISSWWGRSGVINRGIG